MKVAVIGHGTIGAIVMREAEIMMEEALKDRKPEEVIAIQSNHPEPGISITHAEPNDLIPDLNPALFDRPKKKRKIKSHIRPYKYHK